jgi:hypothetical protein
MGLTIPVNRCIFVQGMQALLNFILALVCVHVVIISGFSANYDLFSRGKHLLTSVPEVWYNFGAPRCLIFKQSLEATICKMATIIKMVAIGLM